MPWIHDAFFFSLLLSLADSPPQNKLENWSCVIFFKRGEKLELQALWSGYKLVLWFSEVWWGYGWWSEVKKHHGSLHGYRAMWTRPCWNGTHMLHEVCVSRVHAWQAMHQTGPPGPRLCVRLILKWLKLSRNVRGQHLCALFISVDLTRNFACFTAGIKWRMRPELVQGRA